MPSEEKIMGGCGLMILGFLCWLGFAASTPVAEILGINRVVAGILVPVAILILSLGVMQLVRVQEVRSQNRLLEVLSKMNCSSCNRVYGKVTECGSRGGRPDPGGYWLDCPHCAAHREFKKGELM
jgi:hypothetical protein